MRSIAGWPPCGRPLTAILALLASTVICPGLFAQGADSTAAPDTGPVIQARQSWTSDRRPLRTGDILTIVVDERALASERTSDVARGDRNQEAGLDMSFAPEDFRNLGIGYGSRSDYTGKSERSGSLIAVVSVRVISVDPNGIAAIEGTKLVTIDGRRQELRITGNVRAEDVSQQNTILSSRVADGEIFYRGKKISPKTGILGKLLGLLWP